MKFSRVVTVFAALVMLLVCAGTVFSQEEKKEVTEKATTIVDILKKAECPLTEEQAKQLKELDLSEGREAFRSLYELFDDTQVEALKKALGTRPGRNDNPDRPRYLFQVILFEKAECPLTEKQLEELKALPNERG